MKIRKTSKWLACVGIVGAVGAGAAFGLVGSAGAASSSSKVAKHALGPPVTTASFTFSVAVSGLTPSPVDVTGTGVADLATDEAALSVNLPAVVAGLLPGGSTAPETVQAVLADGTIYLNVPSLQTLVGEPWISVTLPSSAATAVNGILSKVATGLGNVSAIVQLAKSHHATVTSLGSSVVDSVPVTGNTIAAAAGHHRASLSATLWANSSNQLVQADLTASANTKKHQLGVTASLDLSGYGDAVTITVPPAAQVKAIPFATVKSVIGKLLPGGGHHGKGGKHLRHGKRGLHILNLL
ncbi:MAG: hypothetical protein ABSC41_12765 [Acidimicrobiales bacterium]|jgi:hypothetical protein